MEVETARDALRAIGSWIKTGAIRALNEVERDELRRLCQVIEVNLPDRALYNFSAREFSVRVRTSGLLQFGTVVDADALLDDLESVAILLA